MRTNYIYVKSEYGVSHSLFSFLDFDSNHNGVLDDADARVRIENATYGGATKLSTVIDWSTATQAGGEESVVIFGVTGLIQGDFAHE